MGIVLLAAELLAIDAQFFLVFLGAGAITVGLAGLIGLDVPAWAQWISFGIVSLIYMVTVRRKLYELVRGHPVSVEKAKVGQTINVIDELLPGDSCRVEFRGTTWKAVNIGDASVPAGGGARIDVVDGLTLHVRSVDV